MGIWNIIFERLLPASHTAIKQVDVFWRQHLLDYDSKTMVTYMDLSARCAVAKCLVCWWFPDKLALSNLTGLGAVVIPTDCLTDCGFRSRTSWTHWLGNKPFFPRRRPSNIPLLSSPLVTGMEKNGELVNWLIWRPFYFCLIDF